MSFSFEINPRLLIDISHQSQENIEPINDYQEEELVSLEQACQPLENLLGRELQLYITVAKLNSQQLRHGLTQDESASIYLYTMEWNQPQNSFHVLLNQAVCAIDRNQLQSWSKYLKLLFTALFKLPYGECHTVWRGVAKDIREHYREGDEMTWWSLTSVTSSFDVLQSPMYLGKEKVQTIFEIETKYGKSIREHSHLQNDDEIILLPGISLKVMKTRKHADGIYIIHLREINSFGDLMVNINPPVNEYHNPRLEEIIRSLEVHKYLHLDSMNLNDRDMEIVLKLAIVEKKCRALSLRNNAITSVGASVLSQAFIPGTYFFNLILDNNPILDAGVQFLARGLTTERTAVKFLHLNSVGMSDVGCEYLAEALLRNPSTIYLYLDDNKITDRGVPILLKTIVSGSSNITILTLSGNRLITDASVNIICSSMLTRSAFHQLLVRNCGFSTAGKEQLQATAQARGGFIIYI